jgi:hypothetical protein
MGIETHTPTYVSSRSPSPGSSPWKPITVSSRPSSPFMPGGPRVTPSKGVGVVPVTTWGSNPGSLSLERQTMTIASRHLHPLRPPYQLHLLRLYHQHHISLPTPLEDVQTNALIWLSPSIITTTPPPHLIKRMPGPLLL